MRLARGSAWAVVQALVCVFVLFFALRDRRHLLAAIGGLSPLPRAETDRLYARVADSIHATVYATLATGAVQGATGGRLFWALGLPVGGGRAGVELAVRVAGRRAAAAAPGAGAGRVRRRAVLGVSGMVLAPAGPADATQLDPPRSG